MITIIDSNVLIFSRMEEIPEYMLARNKLEKLGKKNSLGITDIIVSESFHHLSRALGSKEIAEEKLRGYLNFHNLFIWRLKKIL